MKRFCLVLCCCYLILFFKFYRDSKLATIVIFSNNTSWLAISHKSAEELMSDFHFQKSSANKTASARHIAGATQMLVSLSILAAIHIWEFCNKLLNC